MKDKKLDLKSIKFKLGIYVAKFQRYAMLAFLAFVLIIYSFVMMRITSLRNTEPTPDQVAAQVKSIKVPHIDEKVVQQLQSLQDNSVSVKALFDKARSNPFQ
jgi:hypothetical protein